MLASSPSSTSTFPALTPVPVAAFLSAMDWRALVLWVIELALDMVICLPFMKAYDQQPLSQEQANEAEV
jgi:PTS system cellobiose-specific IIC component